MSIYIPDKLKYKQSYITDDYVDSLWNIGEAQSYYDKLEILDKEAEVIELRHKANMEELEYAREIQDYFTKEN